MTYDPNTPVSSHLVSVDISNMNTNFSQLNTIFNSDHFNYVSAPPSNRGQHKQITFPVIPTPPVLVGDAGAVYTKLVGGISELFYKNASLDKQLTGPTSVLTAGNSGWITLPGGLVFAWGFHSSTSNTTHQKTWFSATGFTFTNVYIAWICPITNSATTGQFVGLNYDEPAAGTYQNKGFDDTLLYWRGGGSGTQGVYIFGIGN